jgi:Bax protein
MFFVCFRIHQIQLDCEFSDLKVSNSLDRAQWLPLFRTITARNCIFLVFLFFILVAFSSCRNSPENASGKTINSTEDPEKIAVTLGSHQELVELYESFDYGWETVEKGIPPLVLNALPPNLNQLSNLKEKKQVFFLAVLPVALLANQEIQLQRETLLQLFTKKDRGATLSHDEVDVIKSALQYYKLSGNPVNDPKIRRELLKRVDIIPPALTLAQAASESAYGTSRFSRLANNLFGEWTFTPGTGIVPRKRPEGKTYEVRRFKSVSASVSSYIKNLNTHRAYKELREKRAFLRSEGLPLKSTTLADGLLHYSIRGKEYVKSIKRIIRQNRLSRLSQAKLRVMESSSLALGTNPPES